MHKKPIYSTDAVRRILVSKVVSINLYPGPLYLINHLDSLWLNISHYLPNTSIKRIRNYLAGRCSGRAHFLSLQTNRFGFFKADYDKTVRENIYKKRLNDRMK